MLTSLKGGPLWAAVAIVLAIVGAVSLLAYHGTISGDLWVAIITPIIAAVTGVTAAHVTGNQVAAALNTPPPVIPPVTPPVTAPGVAPSNNQGAAMADRPAMPTGG